MAKSRRLSEFAMASAVETELAAHPHEKMIVWAHNVHVQFSHDGARSMGRHLRERLGADYLAVGFLFGHGEFRAVELTDKKRGPTVHTIGPPSDADVSAPFAYQ